MRTAQVACFSERHPIAGLRFVSLCSLDDRTGKRIMHRPQWASSKVACHKKLGGFVNHRQDLFFNLGGKTFDAGEAGCAQQIGWLHSGDRAAFAVAEDGDAAGQDRGNPHLGGQGRGGCLRIAHIVDFAFVGEVDALGLERLLEVMDMKNSEFMTGGRLAQPGVDFGR